MDLLLELKKDPNNVVNVTYDGDEEDAAIFIQLEKQRKLYHKYGTVIEMNGIYQIKNIEFSLYHLLIVDKNGASQPVALLFTKEETTVAISECLRIFEEVKDVKKNSI